MTESQLMQHLEATEGKNSHTLKAMQQKRDLRNEARRAKYADQRKQVAEFMQFIESIGD